MLDLVGELMMRLVRRGKGMYGRFHDYNLSDAVLGNARPLPILDPDSGIDDDTAI